MGIYIDDVKRKHGEIYVCHLTADTDQEFQDFFNSYGLKWAVKNSYEPVWIAPYPHTPEMVGKEWAGKQPIGHKDHYLIPFCERSRMIALGAIPVSLGNEPWRPAMQAIWDRMYISNIEYKRAIVFQTGQIHKGKKTKQPKKIRSDGSRKHYLNPHGRRGNGK